MLGGNRSVYATALFWVTARVLSGIWAIAIGFFAPCITTAESLNPLRQEFSLCSAFISASTMRSSERWLLLFCAALDVLKLSYLPLLSGLPSNSRGPESPAFHGT